MFIASPKPLRCGPATSAPLASVTPSSGWPASVITQDRPTRTALGTLTLTAGIPLVIAPLRVHDDLEDLTFDVNLEDVVRAIDDPHQPGAHRSLIITLLNAAILGHHPYAAKFGSRPLPVTIEEFSDIKLQVMAKLLAWVRESGGTAVQ